MTNNYPNWGHLGPVAQQMLSICDYQDAIGHSDIEITNFLIEATCPDILPFRNFLVRYAGLKLNSMSSVRHSEISFGRIDGTLKLLFSEKQNQWRLFIGETSCGVGLNLMESGTLFMSQPSGYQVSLAESIDTFLEQNAMVWNAHENGMILDRVSTSRMNGARCLSERNGLAVVSKATDSFGSAWIGKEAGIVTSPSFCRRFLITAYWSGQDTALDRHWTRELSSLLEPHMRQSRETEEYKRYRDSGNLAELSTSFGRKSAIRPADSFQIAVENSLAAFVQQGRIDILPEQKADLYEYFTNQVELNMEQPSESLAVYYCSLGLLSIGEITALPMILDHMPLGEGSGWGEPLWGAAFLHYLFPYDFYFDPIKDALAVRNWYNQNKELLKWNERKGIYEHG